MKRIVFAHCAVRYAIAALATLTASQALAQSSATRTETSLGAPPAADPDHGLHVDLKWDAPLAAGSAALWLTSELITPAFVDACRWCDRHPDGSDALNAFDRAGRRLLRIHDPRVPDLSSTLASSVLVPLTAIGASLLGVQQGRAAEWFDNLLVIGEAAFSAMTVNALTKIATARERPDVHVRSPEERRARHKTNDDLSFFSGHATLGFALAVSAGTVVSMRQYRSQTVVWIVGLSLAMVGAALRISADRHYASDVLTGIAVGGAFGFVVPYWFHSKESRTLHLGASPLPQGGALALQGTF